MTNAVFILLSVNKWFIASCLNYVLNKWLAYNFHCFFNYYLCSHSRTFFTVISELLHTTVQSFWDNVCVSRSRSHICEQWLGGGGGGREGGVSSPDCNNMFDASRKALLSLCWQTDLLRTVAGGKGETSGNAMIRLLVSLLVLFSFHVSALKVENGENCSQSALLNTTLLVVGMGLYCHAVLKKNKKQKCLFGYLKVISW